MAGIHKKYVVLFKLREHFQFYILKEFNMPVRIVSFPQQRIQPLWVGFDKGNIDAVFKKQFVGIEHHRRGISGSYLDYSPGLKVTNHPEQRDCVKVREK